MALHELVCPCGRLIPVGVGQAGGEVSCPGCGRSVPVPKLRDLRALPPVVATGGGGGRRWGNAESLLAAGLATAVLSLSLAAWLALPVTARVDATVIRNAIARAPVADLYKAWRSFADAGVSRGATPEEELVARLSRNRALLAAGVAVVGATGTITAIGAAAAIAMRRRLAGGGPPPKA